MTTPSRNKRSTVLLYGNTLPNLQVDPHKWMIYNLQAFSLWNWMCNVAQGCDVMPQVTDDLNCEAVMFWVNGYLIKYFACSRWHCMEERGVMFSEK